MITSGQSAYHAVLHVMHRHVGHANAITLAGLAVQAGILKPNGKPDRRAVEIILQTCKDDFPFIVVGGSSGMYVAVDCDDLNHEIASRQSRIANIKQGIISIKRKATALGWRMESERFVESPKQTEMELF